MTALHILAGTLSLLAGAAALAAPKGGGLHRRSGQLFVLAMLLMAGSGAGMAAMRGEMLSVVAGLLSVYLVASAWLVLQDDVPARRLVQRSVLLLGAVVVVVGGTYGLAGEARGGAPLPLAARLPALVFAGFALLGLLGDLGEVRRGPPRGIARLVRHVWRMSLAMAIATASFFLGQPRFLPAALQAVELRLLPVLAVLCMLAVWLLRLALRRPPRALRPPAAG
jgi:uncharacterized membrane protein